MRREWEDLYRASCDLIAVDHNPRLTERILGSSIDQQDFNDLLAVLRWVLRGDAMAPFTLPVHVVGYSLGGFLAQAVFFAWPQVASSCTTIFSGAAIRALSPTAFAHRDEWQAVLHALRPELQESMLARRLSRTDDGRLAGMHIDQYGYFQRIFDQVFLQEDSASHKERLSEYGSRMLFMSGGEDPIVKPKDTLDASPAEGITVLSVSSLTHFLAQDPEKRPRKRAGSKRLLAARDRSVDGARSRPLRRSP